MSPFKTRRLILALTGALLLPTPVSLAAMHSLTLSNRLNVAITSLTLRNGTVTGFETLQPGGTATVELSGHDGVCNAWLLAHTAHKTAQALIDICAHGVYVVTAPPHHDSSGAGRVLTIVPAH